MTDTPADHAVTDLGAELRRRRSARGVSLRSLAREVDISPSALSQIETGRARPSVGTLYALATKLSVSLDELFGGPPPVAPAAPAPAEADEAERSDAAKDQLLHEAFGALGRPPGVQRAKERRSIELASGVRWERLTAEPDALVDFLVVDYAPGSSSTGGSELMRHAGREYGVVFEGTLTVEVGFDRYQLGPGDSISFDSTDAHRLANEGDEPVRGLWVVLGRRGERQPADAGSDD